ncbi:triosephosphate isomerase, partial [Candidatus Kaiserbacteria bacterium]|nr:triosephosphate isomerase [Candidatus Kaiserbacteria bacterium]
MKKNVPLIIGNWKLNPVKFDEAVKLTKEVVKSLKKVTDAEVAIAPPFVYLHEVGKKIGKNKVALAAQDVFYKTIGAHTGEVSVLQLKELGVDYVIIGHSERRALGESNNDVREKVATVLQHKLTPVVCVGERERD